MRQPKPAPGTTVLSTGFCAEPCDSRGQAIRNDREKSDWLAKMSDRTNVSLAPRPKKRYRTNVSLAPRWQNLKTRSVRVTSIKTSQLKPRKWTKLENATGPTLWASHTRVTIVIAYLARWKTWTSTWETITKKNGKLHKWIKMKLRSKDPSSVKFAQPRFQQVCNLETIGAVNTYQKRCSKPNLTMGRTSAELITAIKVIRLQRLDENMKKDANKHKKKQSKKCGKNPSNLP